MGRLRVAALTLLAATALLGDVGAKLGPTSIPQVPWSVVAAAAVLVYFFTVRPGPVGGLGRWDAAATLALAASFVGLAELRTTELTPLGIEVRVDEERRAVADSLNLPSRRELRRLTHRRRNVRIEATGLVEVPRDGSYRVELDCDDGCELTLGEHRLVSPGSADASETPRPIALEQGELAFSLRYHQLGGPARLRWGWNRPGLLEVLPFEFYVRGPTGPSARSRRVAAYGVLGASVLWWAALFAFAERLARARRTWSRSASLAGAAAGVIILYGCLLRASAFAAYTGHEISPRAAAWLPAYGVFNAANAPEDPYRADVRSYLDRLETFRWTSFYAPSFREPFYIALVAPFVALAGGDKGILLQSLFFSCAALFLFAWIAGRWFGPWWAAALLVPVALHEWLILEAPTGYRLSAYVFFLLATAAAMFRRDGGRTSATVAGGLAGCLTLIRLSALSVVLPLLAIKLWELAPQRRRSYGRWFAAVVAALVLPFLLSNALAHGDPFYSISFHTEFWMRAEGLSTADGPVSVGRYFTDFGRFGALVKGTAVGMTTAPLRTFLNGMRHFPLIGLLTLTLGIAGLAASLGTRRRFLAAAYLGHLIPFAYIQSFPSGLMPRFVMPSFVFLVLAIPVAWRSILTLFGRPANVESV